ncbi:hypothetical protein OGAPHI_001641 [Ogataea philodendri]|uniref:Iron transport multicopper oxidase FET3 n=1 Tax=Ogataea philodendri TaxID=1378263 RepID=A0A9P8PCA8_9ASCO|nr:uncharacterized protein OGAPHI_001641 [Ogataea philodendri]KAH3669045.1 hypothetical protein OGAPHI_001641 [Ogataea philodendri]
MRLSLVSSAFFAAAALAETHVFNWTTGWVNANPDGTYERPVISCNGEFPWPDIRVNKGDRVELYLTNGFTDANTTLHFHGLFQEHSTQMDGPPLLTQCPIAPGDTMLYNFTVPDQVGSFWYHSHTSGQYMDGMRGTFVIEDPDPPYEWDEEVVISLTEWYHDDVNTLTSSFLNVYNPTGAEPIPQNLLMNNTRNNTWHVKPDTTYLVRLINIGGFVSQYLYMEDHTFTIIAVDGVYVEKNETDEIYITVAQRYDVLIHTKNDTSRNYAFMQKFDETMLDTTPDDLVLNATNYIVYNDSADLPDEYTIDNYDTAYFDDFYLVPLDKKEAYDSYDYQVTLDVVMDNLGNGVNYAFFSGVSYVAPVVPALATVMSAGENATDATVYGTNTHSIVLQKDEIVEIVLNNQDTGKHPFHLHGHVFQVIERGPDYSDEASPISYNESAPYDVPEYPMQRDVLYVQPQSYFVIRFKADNPGVWFFHCHIEWHLIQGLAMVFIEDPLGIQANETLTDNWKQVCENVNMSYVGNAAGNDKDFFDLTGQNVQEKALPAGFTARGIVALVFSAVSGVVGIIVIGWYGMSDIPNLEKRVLAGLNPDERAAFLAEDDNDEAEDEPEATEDTEEGESAKLAAKEGTTQVSN